MFLNFKDIIKQFRISTIEIVRMYVQNFIHVCIISYSMQYWPFVYYNLYYNTLYRYTMLNMFKINNFSDSRREGGRTQKSQVYICNDWVLWLELPPFCPAVDATVGRAGSGELLPPQTRVPVPPEQQCQTGGQRGTNQGRYVEGHILSRVWGFSGRKRCKYLCSVHSNQTRGIV